MGIFWVQPGNSLGGSESEGDFEPGGAWSGSTAGRTPWLAHVSLLQGISLFCFFWSFTFFSGQLILWNTSCLVHASTLTRLPTNLPPSVPTKVFVTVVGGTLPSSINRCLLPAPLGIDNWEAKKGEKSEIGSQALLLLPGHAQCTSATFFSEPLVTFSRFCNLSTLRNNRSSSIECPPHPEIVPWVPKQR